jgi:signal transduction histidine kinase
VLLEVNVPLQAGAGAPFLGVGQFLLEGHSVEAEFRELDRHLWFQAGGAFGVAGALLAVVLGWAFRRLRRANRQLEARTGELLRANQELALAARTSAIGAVTSHLIHGLKSPLAGLRQFVASGTREGEGERTGLEDWAAAAASAQRMEAMIYDVVNVLRDEEAGAGYEVAVEELAELVVRRVRGLAERRGVRVESIVEGEVILDNRTANLLALILVNVVHNGIEASNPGQVVRLEVRADGDPIRFRVCDAGPGFPEAFRADPFAVRRSDKEGGTGIGLAISRRLAQHVGAELVLRESTAAGTVFEVSWARPVGARTGSPDGAIGG